MKERIISICILFFAAVTVCLIVIDLPKKNYAKPASDFTEAIRNGNSADTPLSQPSAATDGPASPSISEEVIRLHILADSDSEYDQSVKLALRDVLLPYINAATINVNSKEEAMATLVEHCATLAEIANAFLTEQHTGYTATVSVERIYFPVRIYGSQAYLSDDAVIFPPGYYDSVQVVLGSGEGHNWWCLAYPSLCFIDSSYDYVPKDSDIYRKKIGTIEKSSLAKLFYGNGELTLLSQNDKTTPAESEEITLYFGSKLWEIIRTMLKSVD
jgi:stage II sporulation protein R